MLKTEPDAAQQGKTLSSEAMHRIFSRFPDLRIVGLGCAFSCRMHNDILQPASPLTVTGSLRIRT